MNKPYMHICMHPYRGVYYPVFHCAVAFVPQITVTALAHVCNIAATFGESVCYKCVLHGSCLCGWPAMPPLPVYCVVIHCIYDFLGGSSSSTNATMCLARRTTSTSPTGKARPQV